jgi:endonuclease/exonuclease/phosphatase family metal-dependent hydrolase
METSMTSSQSITIATWNLERPELHSAERREAIQRKIGEIDADIWVLTETSEQVVIDGYHSLATPTLSLRQADERTTMLWSRWPLREVPVLLGTRATEDPPRVYPSYTVSSRDTAPTVCAIVEAPGTPLLLYGTVIAHFADRGIHGTSEYNHEQYETILAQTRDWRRLRAEYPDLPMVIAGDFNATCDARNRPTVKSCEQLRSTLKELELECLTASYWIDHICVSAQIATGAVVADWQQQYLDTRSQSLKHVSDHSGVSATLFL